MAEKPKQSTLPTENISSTKLRHYFSSYMWQVRKGILRLIIEQYKKPIVKIEPTSPIGFGKSPTQKVSSVDFKNRLGTWLEETRGGNRLVLTYRGKIFATVESLQGHLFPDHPSIN